LRRIVPVFLICLA